MWSILPQALQIVVRHMSPLSLNFYRFIVAGVALGCWLAYRGEWPRLRNAKQPLWVWCILVLGLAGNYLFYVYGIQRVPATTAQVVIQLAPVLLGLGSVVFFKEPFSTKQIAGFLILGSGLALFFKNRLDDLMNNLDSYAAGVGYIVLAAIVWVGFALTQKRLLFRLRSPQILLVVYIGAGLLFLPFAEWEPLFELTAWEMSVFLFCILNTLVAYGSFAKAMSHWEGYKISATLTTVPILTMSASFSIDHFWPGYLPTDQMSISVILGACLVVAGSAYIALTRSSPVK